MKTKDKYLPYTMTRATRNIKNSNVRSLISNGDTIISPVMLTCMISTFDYILTKSKLSINYQNQ